jgi:CBS domain-containing protein
LERGRDASILTADEYDSLRGAFDLIYELLLHCDVEAIRAGRTASQHIDPRSLESLTRRYLRSAFREVARVQARLGSEWISRLPDVP